MKGKFITPPEEQVHGIFVDMLKQNHLLIAGKTGSGKSVVINGMIATLLHRIPGHELPGSAEMILIDPKRVELITYRNLPHTIRYASEPADMLKALQYAMEITEQRFLSMQSDRVRLFQGGDVYIFIDEWADLMTTQRKNVVPLIQRLAQLGRAAKVHIVMATQTPIAKIIPTEIKCNFDSRVGLRTRNWKDSYNIIDKAGLENLPDPQLTHRGEGYYMTPRIEDIYEIPYVTENDLKRLIDWWEKQVPACSSWTTGSLTQKPLHDKMLQFFGRR